MKEKNKTQKGLSIKNKITIMFAVMLIIVVTLTFFIFRFVSYSVLKKTVRDYLVNSVEENIDKIRYREDITDLLNEDFDNIYIEYKSGYLEIDEDFLDEMNNASCALYTDEGTLLYGKNPVAYDKGTNPFAEPKIYECESEGQLYLIYDRKLVGDEFDGLWIRGVDPIKDTTDDIDEITNVFYFIIPIIIIICIFVGMITASGMVKPIRKLIENMKEIRNGDDLSSRIDVGNGSDEVYELADNYNEMLDRLEYSFEKEKQFTSDASHELRTPVSVINAQLDLLDDKSTIEEYREAEAVIRRQSRRMTTLIEDMLCFSRLDNGSDMYPKYKFDFSALCKSIAEDMKLIGFKGINLEFEIEDKISICGSEKLLTRMVQNLIDNAYKYGKENGNIKVTLIKEKDNICVLNVSDDGLGIKEEDKEHIFDRFYRADKSRSNRNKTSGNGLGLSMVKKIAQYHDGSVTVDSEYGKGSNFKVSLICL